MNSIRVRLIVLFIVVSTVLSGAFGIYGQLRLSRDLEARFTQIREGALTRLTVNLPNPLWNYDTPAMNSIIAAEMLPPEVRAVYVLDRQEKVLAGITRNKAGRPIPSLETSQEAGPPVTADIFPPGQADNQRQGKANGKVLVYLSREEIDTALRSEMMQRIVEVLTNAALLVVVLTFSLRMVFGPLKQLRDALFELASHEIDDAEELPDTHLAEFGEVITGFNLTQRKLKQVIARTRQAEEETRAGAKQTEEAYSKLKSAQDSLVQSEKMASLGGLVAGVAHEINTPIGIALTSASVLFEETDRLNKAIAAGEMKKSTVTSYAAVATESSLLVMNNASRAAQLIQSFKQVAVDQTSEQRRQYDLKEYIDEVMASLHSRFKQAHVNVTVICPIAIKLDGYPGSMAQVLTNLTMNALTHAFAERESGNTIEIAATAKENMVTMTVTDNGCGIPPAHVAKVFDPFFTTRRGTGGTGLGLNIVFNILNKQFGGAITVQSEVGKGTCFITRFPSVSPAAETDDQPIAG